MRFRFLIWVLCVMTPVVGHGQSIRVVMPEGAPAIASEFHSMDGVNGYRRSAPHQGLDIIGPDQQAIIAVADGIVLDFEVGGCWGPTLTVDHGMGHDGEPLIVLYGHLGEAVVQAGQAVARGQLIGRLGNNQKAFGCIAGVRHLHLQIGRVARLTNRGTFWGHVRYLKDGKRGVNPHVYWADGAGNVTCFHEGATYPKGTITYPVPCS